MAGVYLWSAVAILLLYAAYAEKAKGCGGGAPCIYVSKEKWIPYTTPMREPQYPPLTDSWKKPETTLFTMMASFRDKLCPITLFNAFSKAKYPKRLSFGVVQQNEPGDIDCFAEYCRLIKELPKFSDENYPGCPFESNIRMMKVHANMSKGPTWARALGSTLLRDEEFCMQTDAHMNFVQDWDVGMLQMWAETRNEYAVLSTYVADAETLRPDGFVGGPNGINGLHEVPHLCMVTFQGSYGMVRNWGTKCARMLPSPKLTNGVWGAGLSFSKCHAERKSPYDPHTPHIFDGEEFSRATRFFTWGYDIYTPHRVYVVHDYKKSQADPTHMVWVANTHDYSQGSPDQSVKRLKMLHQMPPYSAGGPEVLAVQQSRYGLGDRRTLDQMINFSGIDTKHLHTLENRCGNIELVPFIEHPFGPDYIPTYDPKTEVFTDVRDPGSVYYTQDMKEQWERKKKEREMSAGVVIGNKPSMSGSGSTVATVVDTEKAVLRKNEEQMASDPTIVYILIAISIIVIIIVFVWTSRMCHQGKATSTSLLVAGDKAV